MKKTKTNLIKIFFGLFGLFLILLISTGCWDKVEINKRAIITAYALDSAKNNKVKLTAEISVPTGISSTGGQGGAGKKPVWITSYEGNTVPEVMRNFSQIIGRRPFWSVVDIIIIGEKAAKTGFPEISDYTLREPSMRQTSWLLVAEGEGGKIFLPTHPLETIPSINIYNILETSEKNTGTVFPIKIVDFIQDITNKSSAAVVPRIRVIEKSTEGENKEKIYEINGAAVFKKDKMIGLIGQYEVEGLNWFLGRVKNTTINVQGLKKSGAPDEDILTIKVLGSKSKIKVQVDENKPKFEVIISFDGRLEMEAFKEDFTKEKQLKKLEMLVGNQIRQQVETIVNVAQQKYQTDFLGLGNLLYARYPKTFKNLGSWEEEFPKFPVEIAVKVNITGFGNIYQKP